MASGGSEEPSRMKKPKGRYVPSRFKQAAENYSMLSSEGTSTAASKTRLQDRQKSYLKISGKESKVNETVLGKKTSTPSKEDASLPNFDESSLFIDKKVAVRNLQTTLNTTARKYPGKKEMCKPAVPVPRIALKKPCKNLDAELDIHYAEYQLALLMENKAKNSLNSKSKTAMKKIDRVLCYVKELLEKHENIRKEINVFSFQLKLHEHLQKQENNIQLPFLKSLPTLEEQYEKIAIAVDNVRHKLNVQNITNFEAGKEEEIVEAVENISKLLDQILESIGNVEKTISSCEANSTYVNKARVISEEIKRGSELLAESKDLLLSESSLNIASIMLKE